MVGKSPDKRTKKLIEAKKNPANMINKIPCCFSFIISTKAAAIPMKM